MTLSVRRIQVIATTVLLACMSPALAGRWQVEYVVMGGGEYNLNVIRPNNALCAASATGNVTSSEPGFDAARLPFQNIFPNPVHGQADDFSVELVSAASFLFEAGFARGRTELDTSISPLFRWVKSSPSDNQPPPTVIHIKESSNVTAYGHYELNPAALPGTVAEGHSVSASNGLGHAAIYEEQYQHPELSDGEWRETSAGEKFYEIRNPTRSPIVMLPTRALAASSSGGIVKPESVLNERCGPHAQINALYAALPNSGHLWVKFDDKLRACAGAVPGDDVHTLNLTAKATQNGAVAANENLKVKFDLSGINYVGLKPPKFVDASGNQVDELPVTTDAQGQAPVRVLSSDLISKPMFYVVQPDAQNPTTDNEVSDKLKLDFGAVESKRRFGIKDFDQGDATDTGWDFDARLLFNRDSAVTAKLHLKFRKELKPAEPNYFINSNSQPSVSLDTNKDGRLSDTEYSSGQVRTMGDASNWLAVPGHRVRIRLDSITGNNDENLAVGKDYVYFTDATGQPLGADGNPASDPNNFTPPAYVEATSDANGIATVYLKAGELINKCRTVKLKAVEQTQKKR